MRKIDRKAEAYRARGNEVTVLNHQRMLVTDPAAPGRPYIVTAAGRVLTPLEQSFDEAKALLRAINERGLILDELGRRGVEISKRDIPAA